MDRTSAINLVKNTFENSFNKDTFEQFIHDLLNRYDEKTFSHRGQMIYEPFRSHIALFERLGKYIDAEGRTIDILIVHLRKDTTLVQARTTQRNFIARYLKQKERDGALVAVVSPDKNDWRFSFVKMEYGLTTTRTGKVSAKEEFTPARRYSFLVGANERSHTAQKSFVPLLENETATLSLDAIEQAFSIETVTKEFFDKYKELFLEAKEALDKCATDDPKIGANFEKSGINTADFAKKLLGQIVFLYFLQKKGWFGVDRDADWGTGHKDFLRRLFNQASAKSDNYFNNTLEPLFYSTLAVPRQDSYCDKFDCKIPFLNGGLFDPIRDYDWVHTDILLPNNLFSNTDKTPEGDIGTGILDVFDRYNFTVCEDEPLEKEVAVDPEMLGKVFENLLTIIDRKSKGAFYTPREIVHYMCQESLIQYLAAEIPLVDVNDFELFIKHGDLVLENDIIAEKNGKETDTYSYKLPESIRQNASQIDEKLAAIKVCDPAVGSGAFLVGMMNEIVRARLVVSTYMKKTLTSYDLKRNAIQNSLYGVDLDPGATEIAKLRLWLSLVVDEDDIHKIKPLPNLDYKIMQGNSLIDEYEGIKLFDEKLLDSTEDSKTIKLRELKSKQDKIMEQIRMIVESEEIDLIEKSKLYEEEAQIYRAMKKLTAENPDDLQGKLLNEQSASREKATKLKSLHDKFFRTSIKGEKDQIKKEINSLEWELIEATLKEQKKQSALDSIRALKNRNIKPFFLWRLDFSEVFQENGGFDIVVANPPYVDSEEMTRSMPEERILIGKRYSTTRGNWDLYIPFWELGYNLLAEGGNTVFITPNKWLAIKYGETLRTFLREHISRIGNCDKVNVFDAGNSPVVVYANKRSFHEDIKIDIFCNDYVIGKTISAKRSVLERNSWGFLLSQHMEFVLKIASCKKKISDDFIAENPFSVSEAYEFVKLLQDLPDRNRFNPEIEFRFLNTGTIDKYHSLWGSKLTTYIKRRYSFPIVARKVFAENMPKRYEQMISPKIIISGMRHFECLLDEKAEFIAGKSTIILKGRNHLDYKFILGLLNTKLISFYIKESYGALGIDGGINFTAGLVEDLPVPERNEELEKHVVKQTENLLRILGGNLIIDSGIKQKSDQYMSEIDDLIYQFYDLTPEEIQIVKDVG